MKNTNHCTKCDSTQIIKIKGGGTWTGYYNHIGTGTLKPILVTRYLCANCGFSEEWIDNPKDIEKLIKKHGTQDDFGDYV